MFQYTGRENDGTGLYYYRARYYHAVAKRFIAEDPIGQAGGFNVSAYVGGNPLSFIDPFGLDEIVFDRGAGTLTYYGDGFSSTYHGVTTGKGGSTDPRAPWEGPIPPGTYTLDPKRITEGWWGRDLTGDWGKYRVPLSPEPGTETYSRSGFFLHGGKSPGSAGCIDVGANDRQLFPQIRTNTSGPVRVIVK
jgi:RHS repeat-associated protein